MSTDQSNEPRYVMVPVPIEHYDELIEEVLRIGMRAAARRWDAPGARKLLAALDPLHRSLLKLICESDIKRSSVADASAALGVTAADIHSMVVTINDTASGL